MEHARGNTEGLNPPNVVLIITDDQGPWALGCAGNEEIQTPHLDALASRGVRLDRSFCTSPVCSPARASIFTGLIPSQHGIHDFILGKESLHTEYLAQFVTLTDVLSSAGYQCGLAGKWHLGASSKLQHGFSHWYALETGSTDYNKARMYREDGQLIVEDGYITDLITEDAIGFLQQCKSSQNAPFFLCVSYNAPHSPWIGQHPESMLNIYKDCEFRTCPQEPSHPWGPSSLDPHTTEAFRDPRPSLQGYFAAVTAMDAGVGRIVDTLDGLDLGSNTIIVFTSDNGFNCGHHGIWGKGNATFPQNMYEESVRVPTIIYVPESEQGGVVSKELISGYDMFPTILDLCDIEIPEDGLPRPGSSFAPLLRGENSQSTRESVVVFSEYGPVRMIRTDEWKYVQRYPFGPNELYSLYEDPHEKRNLVDDVKSVGTIAELRLELESWCGKYVNPVFDGSRLGVSGIGQRGLVGPAGEGREAFYPPSAHSFPRVDFRHFPSEDYPGPYRPEKP